MKIVVMTGIVGVTALVAFMSLKPVGAQDTNTRTAAGQTLPEGFQAACFSCW